MDRNIILDEMDKLAQREIDTVVVEREDFLDVCNYIIKRADFKHFRGDAKHGGKTIYTFLEEARS